MGSSGQQKQKQGANEATQTQNSVLDFSKLFFCFRSDTDLSHRVSLRTCKHGEFLGLFSSLLSQHIDSVAEKELREQSSKGEQRFIF